MNYSRPNEHRLAFTADRSGSSLPLHSGWPERPPLFPPIAVAGELLIPCTASDRAEIGKTVEAGESLVSRSVEGQSSVIAPVAGRIEAIGEASLFDGTRSRVIRLSTAVGGAAVRQQPTIAARPDQLGGWIDAFRRAGIAATRHTSPDILAQCYAALSRPVDTVLLNLLDVDPTLPINAALAAVESGAVRAGAELIARITGATRLWAAVDQNLPAEWAVDLCGSGSASSTPCQVIPMVNAYPQSDPSLLIYALLNRRLSPGKSPVATGAIVLDASAALAIGKLWLDGEPMLSVPIAIRNHARRASHFRTVPLGTPVETLLKAIDLPAAKWLTIRGGDVLRDVHVRDDAVASGSESILHVTTVEPPINPDPCVRCGWCFESCPTLVQPADCLEAAQRNDPALAKRFGIDGCIECGICSYVCPSHLPILGGIRLLRKNSLSR